MTIIFYVCNDIRNSFPKIHLSNALTVTGYFREPTDLTVPRIRIQDFAQPLIYNYLYIQELNRYYFINSYTSISSNMIELNCEEDYLNSWSSQLLQTECFINRSASDYNSMLYDPLSKLVDYDNYRYINYSGFTAHRPFVKCTDAGINILTRDTMCCIIGVAGSPSFEGNKTFNYLNASSPTLNYFATNPYNVAYLIGGFWEENYNLESFITTKISNGSELISSIRMFPFTIGAFSPQGTEPENPYIQKGAGYITLPGYTGVVKAYGAKILGEVIPIAEFSLNPDNISQIFSNDFTDIDSLSTYKLYLPFIGLVSISYNILHNGIYFRYFLDATTGLGTCRLYNYTRTVLYCEYPVDYGVSLSITGSDSFYRMRQFTNIGLDIINTGISAAGAAYGIPISTDFSVSKNDSNISQKNVQTERNPNTGRQNTMSTDTLTESSSSTTTTETKHKKTPLSAMHEIVNGVNSVIPCSSRDTSIINTSATGNMLTDLEPKLYYKHTDNVTTDDHYAIIGRPLAEMRTLGSLNGYVEVGYSLIKFNALYEEIEEIDKLLISGVFINT